MPCPQRLLGRMGTGWRKLEVGDNNEERPVAPTIQGSASGRNGQVDGALEYIHRREDPGAPEVGGASPKLGGYGGLANLTTRPALRDGKLQMSSIGDSRESTSTQNFQGNPIHGEYQTVTTIPLTGPPRRGRPPFNIDWGTPDWSTPDTAASKSPSNVNSKSEEKRFSEDYPPLSPQVSPRTVPSSPTETLDPSSTLWQRTLQVDINMPTEATTYESPRSPPISPPPPRCPNLEQSRKISISRGKRNPGLRSRQTPRRTASLDFACRGGIARASVFNKDIDLGFKKVQLGTATTWFPGSIIQKTRKAVGRALSSTRLIGWRGRERDDKEEDRPWKEGSIFRKPGRTRALKEGSYSTPSPPHPGNRVYISGSSTGASVSMSVLEARDVQAAEAPNDGAGVELKLKRKRIPSLMRLVGR